MSFPLSNIRVIQFQTMLISLFCHLLFATLFLFTFHQQTKEFKPNFIFLGSLLTENDFRNLTIEKTSLKNEALPIIPIKIHSNPLESTRTLPKPVVSTDNFYKEKIFLKSSFLKNSPETPKQNRLEDLGVDLSIPKRVPLKLNLK